MAIVECVNCGGSCGSIYPARTYGDPTECHEAEYDPLPDTVADMGGRDFCSQECCDAWHEEHDEPEEEDDDE
jgi:hypothetical protein